MINVSYKIKSERLKNNFTQEDLAEKIFVSRQTISSWENGRSLPNYENLVLLSKLFNIPIDHFYSAPDLEKIEICTLMAENISQQNLNYGT